MSLPASTYDTAAAERRAERIRLRLDAIADNIDAVLPMIREAIEKGDHAALGYRSVGEYVSDRFGGALTRLPVDLRRPVVHELASAGMSVRAIAPVVGVSVGTVHADQQQVFSSEHVNTETGEVSDDYDDDEPVPAGLARLVEQHSRPAQEVLPAGSGEAAVTSPTEGRVETPPAPRPSVTGLDGKTYRRPEPRAPKRRALPDQFFEAAYDMGKAIEKVARLTEDDRFPQNAEKVAAKHRNDLLRARDLLQRVIDSLPKEEDSNA
jgi:hypothetical protein